MTYLEFARRDRKWSHLTLGELPTVRISRDFISLLERGIAIGTPDQRERLAKALGVPVEKLLEQYPSIEETLRAVSSR